MKPVAFAYHAPESLGEALQLVATREDSVLLAGGQSLMPLLNMRLVRPSNVIDLGRIPELRVVDATDTVRIGAMVRQHVICTGPQLAEWTPLLAFATRFVGQPHTRSRGTIGGSIAFGSNVAAISVALLALDASLTLAGPGGSRIIPLTDFFVDYQKTELRQDEILTHVDVPSDNRHAQWGFSELKFRGCDFPIVMCAVALVLDRDGVCRSARVAVGGASPIPLRLFDLESQIADRPLSRRELIRLADEVGDMLDPVDDGHAPADYRRHTAIITIQRALLMAMDEATGGKADA